MTRARALLGGLFATVLLAACGSSAPGGSSGLGTGTSLAATAPASAGPVTSAPPTTAASSPASSGPTGGGPSSIPSPVASIGTVPDPTGFWARAAGALDAAQRVRVIAKGPSPGEIRYEPKRSATILADMPIFVCVDGVAYDGQNGFEPTPGPWDCGVDAFVGGFRHLGQPVDAWSRELEASKHIKETVAAEADGTWRWDYAADSPQYGGPVAASVWLDPATGRIVRSSRKDPIGRTTWTVEYGATFPTVALPGS